MCRGHRSLVLHARCDVYAHEARLAALYPGDHNVRPKIRQQLKALRDQGYLQFVGRGHYRLATAD